LLAALVLAASSLPAAWNQHLTPQALRTRFHFRWNSADYLSEYEQWEDMDLNTRKWTLVGKALALYTRPGESLVATTMGAKGFYSDLVLYDRNGLVSREVARTPPPPERKRSPGHDRLVPPEFFLDQHPTYLDARLGAVVDARDLERHTRVNAEGRPEEVIPLAEADGFPAGSTLVLVRPP